LLLRSLPGYFFFLLVALAGFFFAFFAFALRFIAMGYLLWWMVMVRSSCAA
jgi:hypothetical protein